jgi:hypothetical protein
MKLQKIDPEQAFNEPKDIYNIAANWELAGLSQDKSYYISKKDQMRLLGKYYGRGRVFLNIQERSVQVFTSACFGNDYNVTTYAI